MIDNQQTSLSELLNRVARWGLVGAVSGLEGSNLRWWTALGPLVERACGFSLEEVLAEVDRQRREELRQQRYRQVLAGITGRARQVPASTTENTQATPLLVPGERLEMERDGKWREVIVRPAVVLILGKRGSGKSGLGYRLLELFRYESTAYVLGVPGQARKLLPDWIGIAQSLEDIPPKSIVLVDEAYLRYHSRDSLSRGSKEMSRIVNLSRQRNQTLIFVSQEARQVDKNIASSANVVVFKDLGILQLESDRREFAKVAADAKEAFAAVAGDRRKWSYVYSPDSGFMGILENSLPTYWSDGLSHIFGAGGEVSTTRPPAKATLGERIQKAKELRRGGLSYGEISSVLGVTKGTAYNYVKGYPYGS